MSLPAREGKDTNQGPLSGADQGFSEGAGRVKPGNVMNVILTDSLV